ncbi:MAG: hypothetical protein CMM52_06155 [Rhodospirillaceae bacterium]|nr:hypothetical protein [Rhodospirillaceae bacterium]|tara:strand:+ start:9219 stop:9494 length:276 start_codon:yes stop_codon:yes gene_type:complete
MADQKKPDEKSYWLDDRNNVKKLVLALYVACGLSFVADFFYHKHVHYDVENWIGIYPIFGLVACAVLFLGAKLLRTLFMRDEDYYQEADDD